MAIQIFFLFLVLTTCLGIPQYGGDGGGGGDHGNIDAQCGDPSYTCVPYFQCINGVVNTDGTGLIDVRIRPPGNCQHPDPEYQDVPAVCCLKPTAQPITKCPGFQECVEFKACSVEGYIVTDGSGLIDIRTGFAGCHLPSGNGICCNPPPPYIDQCPVGSVCTSKLECIGKALDHTKAFADYSPTGYWSHCSYGSENGVCCVKSVPQVIDSCPGDSICVKPKDCLGTALDAGGQFVDYAKKQGGTWGHCSQYKNGVCCINPYTDPILRPANECGVRNYKIDERITTTHHGVNEAAFGEFPWQTIIFFQNYTFVCGASLISHKHLITAAHCVDEGIHPSDIRIRFGEWQVNSFDEPLPYEDRNVNAIYIHPAFNPKNVHNDIAILEIKKPVEFKYHINTICLPAHGQHFDPYTPCFASGWGKDSFTGSFQHILKKIDLPYVEPKTCQDLLRKTRLGKFFKLDPSFICAGGQANKDACYGDGGGPLVCKDQAKSRYVIVGITSWGIGCGTEGVPGVYANVEAFSPWVDEIVLGKGQHQTVPGYGK